MSVHSHNHADDEAAAIMDQDAHRQLGELRRASVDIRYRVSTQDNRDSGAHIVSVSMIDQQTGIRAEERIAVFVPSCKAAAEAYVAWLNSKAVTE